MRWRIALTIFRKELLETVRDRRTLVVMLILPIVLYPLLLIGGRRMGFKHGQYLNYAGDNPAGGPWNGGTEPWQREVTHEDIPLSNLFVTMLQRLGVKTDKFSDSTGTLAAV